jgi:hypothetical protein
MGGKAAIIFALQHSRLLHKLIVEDVAPKPYSTHMHALFPESSRFAHCGNYTRKFYEN